MSSGNVSQRFSVYHNGVDPVVALLSGCSPTAVVGSVDALVVDPIKALSLGSWSHVLVEVLELSPPFANSNTPTTVIMVGFALRVFAPLQHTIPRPVDRRAFHAVGFTAHHATATTTPLGVA